ncbi:MAG: DUF362 domain-containing protein [Desulfuromonadales bacterium]|nr:DUF362 domain-containing protein [Desulfuromonadales bacterium]
MTSQVSMIKGQDRREDVRRSLEQIEEDILALVGNRRIVIKPNFVSTSIQLAATHVDHVRGILDFFKEVLPGENILIAEAAPGNTWKAFKHFGYEQLVEEYPVELVDLNQGPFHAITLSDWAGKPMEVRASKLLLEENPFLVSAARLKTHDTVVVTLSIKNMAMGSILSHDKSKVHQGIPRTNRNIAELARHFWPDLSVIDGYEGMEGDGPTFGDPIHVGIAISGTDALAVDRIACEVMGVGFRKVGYLFFCEQMGLGEAHLNNIQMVGSPLEQCITPFRLHRGVEEQYRW